MVLHIQAHHLAAAQASSAEHTDGKEEKYRAGEVSGDRSHHASQRQARFTGGSWKAVRLGRIAPHCGCLWCHISTSSATGVRLALIAGSDPTVACYEVTSLSLSLCVTEERGHDGMGKIHLLVYHSVPLVLSASAPAETGLWHLTKHKVLILLIYLFCQLSLVSYTHIIHPVRDS